MCVQGLLVHLHTRPAKCESLFSVLKMKERSDSTECMHIGFDRSPYSENESLTIFPK